MRDLLEVKEFYVDANQAALESALHICSEIITEPLIAEKIALGLKLGPILEMVTHTTTRLKEIADQPVLKNSIARPARSGGDIAATAAMLGDELKSHVLYGPDMAVLKNIAENCPAAAPAIAVDSLPRLPARDPSLPRSPNKPFKFPEVGSVIADKKNYLGFLFYVLVDVEISAMEVCAYMALRNRDMPAAFALDMARQIWDEARHAAYIYKNYTELGGEMGAFPYTNTVIDRFNMASNLVEGLIVQQVLQEANAVENNIALANDLAEVGRNEEALSFLVINNDEALHARIGFAWIEYLAEKNGWPSDFLFARTVQMTRKIGLPLFGMGTWTDIVRTSIGCPEWLMHKKTFFGEFFSRPTAH
jgi:uncharacterized ferritin-like protein (DUF455 family)